MNHLSLHPKELTQYLRQQALALGFEAVGIARAEELTDEARKLEQWLHRGLHGSMGYMANYFEQRIDPRRLVEGAQSVVSLLFNYYSPKQQIDADAPKISMYAHGKDYHDVLKGKLRQLLADLQAKIGDINGRCFVDSAPILERQWAERAGLGWQGKHTLLISPRRGSYFFLAELVLDIELEYDAPFGRDHCGTCRRCIDACPTQAIDQKGFLLDASKCISYLTIELREAIPDEFRGRMDNWMFGCDVCQQVCPWNRFAAPHQEPEFNAPEELLSMPKREWQELTEEVFKKLFPKSPVKRSKYAGLMRNIRFVTDI